MNTQHRWLWAGLILVLSGLAGSAQAADGWRAGAARAKITPEKYMWMSGYGGRDKPADGKLTELWAKALVLEANADNRVVLVSLDLVGIDAELSGLICARLESEHKVTRDRVAICTSHTHSGPVVGKNLGPLHYYRLTPEHQALVDQYAKFLAEQVVAVVGEAIRALAPATLSWGSGRTDFAVNRRNNPEAMVPELRAAGKLKGPVDHDVPVLAVRSPDGKLRAVAFGYACHATVLPFYQWCADYPGYAQIELEKSHPDCVALFWAGCGADQNPLPRRQVELAQEYGRRLAVAVDEVLNSGKLAAVAPNVHSMYKTVALPLDKLPTRDMIAEEAKSTNVFLASRAKMLLKQIDDGRPLAPSYQYPIQRWKLGQDIEWIFLGGEVVVDYAIRLKSERRGTKTWVAGYSNDVMAYIPSRRVLIEGGYEGAGAMVYYGLPTIWGPEVEEVLIKGVDAN